MRSPRRAAPARVRAAALLVAALALPSAAGAQQDPGLESRALREAAGLESRGRLEEAQAVLERLLEDRPESSGGLFALERVLRSRGLSAAVLPHADRYLERVPGSDGVRYLKLRVLAEVDSLGALADETEAWIGRAPAELGPYREAARLWESAFGAERALELLERGREASGDPAALAAEIGDLLLRTGEAGAAATEWAASIGHRGESAEGLLRRVRQIEELEARSRAARVVLDALVDEPTTAERRAVAVQVALAGQLPERALDLAPRVAEGLERAPRRAFLQDLARWSDEARAHAVALWALTQLRAGTEEGPDARALDARLAEAALAAGERGAAMDATRRLAAALPAGSAERRRVLVGLIRLEAEAADAEALRSRLADFRREFPQAPELDELAAAVARGLQGRGQPGEAATVLADVSGPRSSLERAFLLLERGELEEGRAALVASVEGLPAAHGTAVIQLASLLGRLGPAGAAAVARAAVAAHRGDGRSGALALEAAAASLPPAERPVALAHAARLAAGSGAAPEAARIRSALVDAYPDAPEAHEAALALARWHASSPAGVSVAVRLLEELILRAPSSAVVPDARRELQRLRGRS